MRRVLLFTIVSLASLQTSGLAVPPLHDDFNDNEQGVMWTLYEEDNSTCWIDETNGSLRVRATSAAMGNSAMYFSRGWRFDPAHDFTLKVDYNYSPYTLTDGWVSVALVLDPNDPWTNSISFDIGCESNFPYSWYGYIESGSLEDDAFALRLEDSGTLYLTYDSSADTLYLSNKGYGAANALFEALHVLKNIWGGVPVYLGVGGGSDGTTLNWGDADLDDFIVESSSDRWVLDNNLPDFDGDSKSDLLWRQASTGYQTVTVMDGLSWGGSGWLGGDLDWQIVATPDFDGDGKSDLIWRQLSTGYQIATIMDGTAMVSSGWLGGNTDWQIVGTPDFNGDGKSDLLWRQVSTGYHTATIMDGLIMVSNGLLGANPNWQIVATPDFNGDGKSDLLWRELSTGYQTGSIMNGLAIVTSGLIGGNLDWQIVAAPDFNGDGKADLLWDQLSTGYQTASIMDGLAIVSNGWIGGSLDWSVESTPDLNGDGKSDLLWRQLSTGYQTATIMDGLTIASSGWIGGDSDRQVLAVGDFNGDGKSDLLWKQWSTGCHTATLMDGLTTAGHGWIGGDWDWAVQPMP